MTTATMPDFATIGRKLMHPTQQKILARMSQLEAEESISPNQLSQEVSEPLGNVSYHVSVLAGGDKGKFTESPLIELVKTEPRRGALEHFYALVA